MGRNEALTHAITWTHLGNIMLIKKVNTKGHILYESTYIKCPEYENL